MNTIKMNWLKRIALVAIFAFGIITFYTVNADDTRTDLMQANTEIIADFDNNESDIMLDDEGKKEKKSSKKEAKEGKECKESKKECSSKAKAKKTAAKSGECKSECKKSCSKK